MQYRKFGSLDFDVSVIGFGGAAVSGEGGGYGFGAISDKESEELLISCKEKGINLFDTAPIYGFGLSEKRIGNAFKKFRDSVFLVSKCGLTWDQNKRVHISNEPAVIEKMLEQSLIDLQTDYIDLYMVHWPDPKVDIRKTMEALSSAKKNGKIKAIGLCNSNATDIEKAFEVDRVDVLQSKFNLFDRQICSDIWPSIQKHKIGFMAYGTYDQGILTGRVTADRKFDSNDLRAKSPIWLKQNKDPKFAAVEKLKSLAQEANTDLVSLALGGVLNFPETSTALCGIKSSKQLESTLEAVNNLPSKTVIEQAIAICSHAASK